MDGRPPRRSPARVVSLVATRMLKRMQRHPSVTIVFAPEGTEVYVVGVSDDKQREEFLRLLEAALSA